jgi:hypothetical protein
MDNIRRSYLACKRKVDRAVRAVNLACDVEVRHGRQTLLWQLERNHVRNTKYKHFLLEKTNRADVLQRLWCDLELFRGVRQRLSQLQTEQLSTPTPPPLPLLKSTGTSTTNSSVLCSLFFMMPRMQSQVISYLTETYTPW